MPSLVIPAALRRLMQSPVSELDVEGQTVREVLEALVDRHPGLRDTFFDADGGIRRFVRIYIGENDIETLQGAETPVSESDEIVFLPPIAGG